jgi:dTDP-4-dehydrorhamnose 3,5-epimerase
LFNYKKQEMEFIEQAIQGVWVIEPKRFGDKRGYFSEVFKQAEFDAHVGRVDFVQDNESLSSKGVLRGLHFQRGECSQAKLVRVSQGTVLDVVVDLRHGSPTWGQHLAVELSADTGRQLFIPRGFAHGFVVLSDMAQFQYKVDNLYAPHSEATLRYDDPALGIDWRIDRADMLLSEKDLKGHSLDEMTPDFLGF